MDYIVLNLVIRNIPTSPSVESHQLEWNLEISSSFSTPPPPLPTYLPTLVNFHACRRAEFDKQSSALGEHQGDICSLFAQPLACSTCRMTKPRLQPRPCRRPRVIRTARRFPLHAQAAFASSFGLRHTRTHSTPSRNTQGGSVCARSLGQVWSYVRGDMPSHRTHIRVSMRRMQRCHTLRSVLVTSGCGRPYT